MDAAGFLQMLADLVGWVVQHGRLVAGALVALIILAYLLARRD